MTRFLLPLIATPVIIALTVIIGVPGCKPGSKPSATVTQQHAPTMADYWEGNAYFHEFYTENLAETRFPSTEIVPVNGVWYRFERYYITDIVPVEHSSAGLCVFKSTDKGMSWSEHVIIAAPGGDNDWSRYAIDGGAYYDGNRWHLLFQSLSWAKDAQWNISYLVCDEEDATTGTWYVPPGVTNPVIRNRDIWDRIAIGDNDCTKITGAEKQIYDEGTPKILVDDRTIYVTFHGASKSNNGITYVIFDGHSTTGSIYGYRGIASTTDFTTYTPAANDCIFDLYDAQSWDVEWQPGGTIGGGAAAYIKDGEYWYTLIESPDISLDCALEQNWPFGLLRSKHLTDTKWENWISNPPPELRPVGPSKIGVPTWSYSTLFKDDGITYMGIQNDWSTTWDSPGYAYRLYRLEWKENPANAATKNQRQ